MLHMLVLAQLSKNYEKHASYYVKEKFKRHHSSLI